MKTIKLLVLLKTLDGGTGTFVRDLLTIRNNTLFKVICLERSNIRSTKNISFFANNELYPDQYVVSGKLIVRLFKEFLWFKNICKTHSPNIILTIDAHCLLLATACKPFLSSKIKLIATIHNNLEAVVKHKVPPHLRIFINRLISKALNRADRVVCVSKGLAENLFMKYELHTKPKVIYYGLSHKYADNAVLKPKKLVNSRKKIILSVGRFVAQKDFTTIIKAFGLVINRMKNLELWLVGDGPEKQELKELVSKLRLNGKVKFLGWQQELLPIYRKADIFVFASNWEGFGYVILEAMSQGLPVIATDTNFGPREIIDNKYGILINKNSFILANIVIDLLSNTNKHLLFSRRAIQRISKFKISKMLTKYLSFFYE